jgi:hypothetical protein
MLLPELVVAAAHSVPRSSCWSDEAVVKGDCARRLAAEASMERKRGEEEGGRD